MNVFVPKAARDKIDRLVADGRGQGRGSEYKPFVRVQDFSSTGEVCRWWSPKLQRHLETFSGQETTCGRLLLWSPVIVDLHEQYPLLPIEDTMGIAHGLGVEHPMEDGLPKVLTTDFHFEAVRDGQRWEGMRAYKPSGLLEDRNLVKLEIERRYAELHGIHDWALITDLDLPEIESSNVNFLSGFDSLGAVPGLELPNLGPMLNALAGLILAQPTIPISDLCGRIDAKFGEADRPRCLAALNYAYATGAWPLDIHVPYEPTSPIHPRNLERLKAVISR